MTINQLFNRFLKENKLYGYVIEKAKYQKKMNKSLGYKKFYGDCALGYIENNFENSYNFKYFGPEYLVMYLFRFGDERFRGDSKSSSRRRLYRLNRKWKDFIKNNVVLQYNINEGDKIAAKKFGVTNEYFVSFINKDSTCSIIGRIGDRSGYRLSLFSIKEIEGKDLVINLYIKDKNGNCYGKLEGEYNEIQL